MAYDDGFYYGQCKIICTSDKSADNGKTVLITTTDGKTYSSTLTNLRCEFMLAGRTLYKVQLVASGKAEYTTEVEAGYGDCILVHLSEGYNEVMQKDLLELATIKSTADANLAYKGATAKAVKEVNAKAETAQTTANGKVQKISGTGYVTVDALGYDSSTKTLKMKVGGADSVINFNRPSYALTSYGVGAEVHSSSASCTLAANSEYIVTFGAKGSESDWNANISISISGGTKTKIGGGFAGSGGGEAYHVKTGSSSVTCSISCYMATAHTGCFVMAVKVSY